MPIQQKNWLQPQVCLNQCWDCVHHRRKKIKGSMENMIQAQMSLLTICSFFSHFEEGPSFLLSIFITFCFIFIFLQLQGSSRMKRCILGRTQFLPMILQYTNSMSTILSSIFAAVLLINTFNYMLYLVSQNVDKLVSSKRMPKPQTY